MIKTPSSLSSEVEEDKEEKATFVLYRLSLPTIRIMKFPLISALLLSGSLVAVHAHDDRRPGQCANTVTTTMWNIRTRYINIDISE